MSIKAEARFSNVVDTGGAFFPQSTHPGGKRRLPAGVYKIGVNMEGQFFFKAISFTSDEVLDLPSPAYQQVITEMERFTAADTRAAFKKLGYVYKRSALLHGPPGTGKTCLVNRIAEKMVKDGHIVLFAPNPGLLEQAFSVLEDLQPDQTTVVVFEEFDQIINEGHEEELLVLLDGQVQKDNVMYLATTNYLERISPRMYRPGRISSVIEVGFPTPEAREFYLRHKLGAECGRITELVEATGGFSIDEVKEVVQSVFLLGQTLADVTERIKASKQYVEAKAASVREDENLNLASPFEVFSREMQKLKRKQARRS